MARRLRRPMMLTAKHGMSERQERSPAQRDFDSVEMAATRLVKELYPLEYATFFGNPFDMSALERFMGCRQAAFRMIDQDPYLLAEWGNP